MNVPYYIKMTETVGNGKDPVQLQLQGTRVIYLEDDEGLKNFLKGKFGNEFDAEPESKISFTLSENVRVVVEAQCLGPGNAPRVIDLSLLLIGYMPFF